MRIDFFSERRSLGLQSSLRRAVTNVSQLCGRLSDRDLNKATEISWNAHPSWGINIRVDILAQYILAKLSCALPNFHFRCKPKGVRKSAPHYVAVPGGLSVHFFRSSHRLLRLSLVASDMDVPQNYVILIHLYLKHKFTAASPK